jgi:hypothetical protein
MDNNKHLYGPLLLGDKHFPILILATVVSNKPRKNFYFGDRGGGVN